MLSRAIFQARRIFLGIKSCEQVVQAVSGLDSYDLSFMHSSHMSKYSQFLISIVIKHCMLTAVYVLHHNNVII